MEKRSIKIPNMSCNHCIHTIESELRELAGFISVTASLDTKQVDITWDKPLDWDRISSLLREINYPPEE